MAGAMCRGKGHPDPESQAPAHRCPQNSLWALPTGSCPQPGWATRDVLHNRPGVQEAAGSSPHTSMLAASRGMSVPIPAIRHRTSDTTHLGQVRPRAMQTVEAQDSAPQSPPQPQPHLRQKRWRQAVKGRVGIRCRDPGWGEPGLAGSSASPFPGRAAQQLRWANSPQKVGKQRALCLRNVQTRPEAGGAPGSSPPPGCKNPHPVPLAPLSPQSHPSCPWAVLSTPKLGLIGDTVWLSSGK